MKFKNNWELLAQIALWHRSRKDGDGFFECVERYNKQVKIVGDVHTFSEKGEGIIPNEQARQEAAREKCGFCEYLRKLARQEGK